LAALAGIRQEHLSRIETGRKNNTDTYAGDDSNGVGGAVKEVIGGWRGKGLRKLAFLL
jgi:hypothetical protein